MTIVIETRILIQAALEGDPTLSSLAVAGSTPGMLSVHIAPGVPARSIGGSTYDPEPSFRRETFAELIVRMQRLRWQRVDGFIRMLEPPDEKDLQALRIKHTRALVPFECGGGMDGPVRRRFHLAARDRARPPVVAEPDQGKVRNRPFLLAR